MSDAFALSNPKNIDVQKSCFEQLLSLARLHSCDDRGTSLAGLCLWIDNMDEITVHQARFAVSAIPSGAS